MENRMYSIRAMTVIGIILATAAPAFAQGWPGAPQQVNPSYWYPGMGFGGIFAPFIRGMMQPSQSDSRCAAYSNYAACQAAKNGDLWAADRLQNNEASGAERDWYNR